MNIFDRTLAWLTGRKPQPDMTIRCSIHTGDQLTEESRFTIEDSDILMVQTRAGNVTALDLEVPIDTPRGTALTTSGFTDGSTAFARVTFNGAECWLRMQRWRIYEGQLTVDFSRDYESTRWTERHGYYRALLTEPSPPVPFDEHHPHYEGSARQHAADLAIDAAGGW